MTNIHISIQRLQKYLGKTVGNDRLQKQVAMMGTDVDGIDGDTLTVEIFPNRPDLLNFHGFARALAAFLDMKPGIKLYDVDESKKEEYKVIIDSSVESVRPYTVCAVVSGLSFTDENIKEIIELQEKLHMSFGRNRKRLAIGIYPMESIAMPIRYLAKKPEDIVFTPLESRVPMNGYEILQEHPTGKEYAHLLEGMKAYPIFIDANNQILSMPPIINSEKTGRVSENTKDVFIECSGHNVHVLEQSLSMIACVLADMGGKVHAMTIQREDKKMQTPQLSPKKIKVSESYIQKVLGIKPNNIADLLARMNMSLEEKNEDELTILYPAYRTDIMHPIDIVEDIAIAYGYDNIPQELPNISTVGKEAPIEITRRHLAALLVGHGLMETSTYHLVTEDACKKVWGDDVSLLKVKDAKTEYKVLRKDMLTSMLLVLTNNLHHEYPQHIFEMGNVFYVDEKAMQKVLDRPVLSIMLAEQDVNFTKVRQLIDDVFASFGIQATFAPSEDERFISGRAADMMLDNRKIGALGELHPKIISAYGIEVPVAAAEVDLSVFLQE